MRFRWFLIALVAAGLLAALHLWALDYYFYWKHPWFDALMHLLGGLAVGAFAVACLNTYRPVWYLLIVVVAVVAWEVFEYQIGLPAQTVANYTFDTASDLLNDTIGAGIVYVCARFTFWRTTYV